MTAKLFDPDAPLDAKRCVAIYETLRHRKPGNQPRETESHRSLGDILHHFDALLLDGYGVLNVGEDPVPGVGSLFEEAARSGVALMVLTNGASRLASFAGAKYRGFGLPVTDEQVVSSRDAMFREMEDVPGPIGLVDDCIEMPGDDRYVQLDPSRPEEWTRVAGISFLGSIGWDASWQDCLRRAMEAGVPVHVANPDVTAPLPGGFTFEPGFWVASALADLPEAEAHWYGKPHGPVFDLALERLAAVSGRTDLDRGRVGMVGDTLHTDILGGNAAGLRSVLVTGHGLFSGGGADEAIERTGIKPDFAIETVWAG